MFGPELISSQRVLPVGICKREGRESDSDLIHLNELLGECFYGKARGQMTQKVVPLIGWQGQSLLN